MKSIIASALLVFSLPSSSHAAKVTPTQKVITMMSEMKAKGDKMMEEEQKVYAAYAEWADDRSKELAFDIQDAGAKIEELTAFISKADSDVAQLGKEIEALDAEIDKLSAEKQEATDIRASEHAEYLKVSKDLGESVDALARAVQVVSAQNYDRPQAEALLQSMAKSVPGMPAVLGAFLQQAGAEQQDGAPAVAAYDSQSGGVLALLEGLHKKFKQELADVEEDEANQAHEFSLVELHLSDTITKDTSDRDEKTVLKGERAAASAKAKGDLAETKASKAEDEKLKAEIEATFKNKDAVYQQNQKIREDELKAIAKAIEIISSPAVAGSYATHINFAQRGSQAASFLQMGRSRRRLTSAQRATELLARRAKELGSKALAAVASRVAASPNFSKVIDMIEELVERLKQEAAAEADHKAWCDEQLKANKLKRNKKTARANQLTAEIEGYGAQISEMGQRIDTLTTEQAQLTKAMQEATAIREKEHSENTQAIADAKAGVEAVKSAIVVLKEFYSAQEASLLQQRQVPEMAEYNGMQSNKGGVIGMLEVISSDFARLRAETETAEKAAAMEYDAFMEESTTSKQRKHEEEVKLRLEKDQAEFEKGRTEKNLRATEEELAKANKYFEELKPACLEVQVNWEERVAKRKEEIEALKQAWNILDQKSKQ